MIANICHAVRNDDGGQATAPKESISSNACYAVWNDDGGQATAPRESPFTNARHAVWNNCVITPCNKGICESFNNSITRGF